MRQWLALCAILAVSASVAHAGKPLSNYESAKRVVYAVFPDSTQSRALSVVGCETGGTYSRWALNRTSGTAGLFQIHPGNIGRVVYWRGHGSHTIGANLHNSWVNARAALYLSSGGVDWHEWASICRR